ncbi:MAG: SEL1-like repeat protein [Methylobacillus sp.]|jgi:TPR repeat protein|nr:SEL1-like repeat protein [Methylobacillus sp.]
MKNLIVLFLLCFAASTWAQNIPSKHAFPSIAQFPELLAAAEGGDAEAQFNLGIMYRSGWGKGRDDADDKAVLWLEKAADQGHVKAQYELGSRALYFSNDVPLDIVESEFRRAANQGFAAAQYMLGWIYQYKANPDDPQNAELAFHWYHKAAEQGDNFSQYILSSWYFGGLNTMTTLDTAKAVAWLRKASQDQVYDVAQEILDQMDKLKSRNGNYMSLTQIRKAATQGNAEAQYMLGMMYMHGWGLTAQSSYVAVHDAAEAANWYRKAADQGHVQAQYALAFFVDDAESTRWFRKAADQGLAAAQYQLGWIYQNGLFGETKSNNHAVSWFRKAANQGYADAQYALGEMYRTGNSVKRNEAEATAWLRKAADQNHGKALYRLSEMHRDNRGIPNSEGLALLRKAADQHDPEARYALGQVYLNGWGVDKDEAQAMALIYQAADLGGYPAAKVDFHIAQDAFWIYQAADEGDADAQYNLAMMYMQGRSMPKDCAQAKIWWDKANTSRERKWEMPTCR